MFCNADAGRLAALCSCLALFGLLLGCGQEAATGPRTDAHAADRTSLSRDGATGPHGAEVRSQLADLRRATAPYHDVENAEADGWEVRFPEPCLTHSELGGMGSHLLNADLLDGEVAVTEPEFLVYEPGPAGAMWLVAVEYVVPFTVRPADAAPPELLGHHFHPNETFGVWAFHVWVWRHNPSGLFADWNPRVSCEHAESVRTFPEA